MSIQKSVLSPMVLLLAIALPLFAQTQPMQKNNFQVIVSRERQLLLQSKPSATDASDVKAWVGSLGKDGTWSDIDYTDENRATWKTTEHLKRIETMSRILASDAPGSDSSLEAAALLALDHWIAKKYKNPNWWHNDIGVPTTMRDIILLLGGRLQGERRMGALTILNQYGRARAADGTNTIWEAELGMTYGVLTENADLVTQQSALISGEIHVSDGQGIQSDWSFHQHQTRLQQFHYGGAFINDTAQLSWILHDTPWAISPEKMQILANYVLEGSQWMVRGTRTAPGTIDRAVSRPDSQNADLRTVAQYLRDAVPNRASELDALIARQNETGTPLIGFRAFPRSDFSVYHRPKFSVFLKTVSNRTLTTETQTNSENLKGQNLACGDLYILRDGNEYNNLQPVWDWDLLPGITWAKDAGQVQRQPFVGAIGNDTVGATAMDYAFGSKTDPSALTAHKFWACDGDTTVCLIGDLTTHGMTDPVRTALDQSLLRSPVTMSDTHGTVKTLPNGMTQAQSVRWIHHSGLAYIPIGPHPISFQLGPATGSRYDINRGYSTDPVTAPIFMPILEQGTSPIKQASGYVIVPSETPDEAAELAAHPTWEVLRNDADCQAVRFTNGNVMAAFYKPGKLESHKTLLLEVDQPCLALISKDGLRLSDPTQIGTTIHVMRENSHAVNITVPPGGLSSQPIH